jgi:hypothetical protein
MNGEPLTPAENIAMLKSLPQTPDRFRKHAADLFWHFSEAAAGAMRPKAGYRLTDSAIQEFEALMTEAYWRIMTNEVEGEPPGV